MRLQLEADQSFRADEPQRAKARRAGLRLLKQETCDGSVCVEQIQTFIARPASPPVPAFGVGVTVSCGRVPLRAGPSPAVPEDSLPSVAGH